MLARLALIATLLLPVTVHAQTADADMRRAQELMATRAKALHDRLRITPAQQPRWDAFTAVMAENARHVAALHAGQASAPRSALDDLKGYAAAVQAHADDVARLVGPFEQLYASMSPDQKVLADRTFREFEQREVRRRPGA